MERLSEYLTLAEGIKSDTAKRHGIDNTPTPDILENMKYVAREIFDICRVHVGGPLAANSFYRSRTLNRIIGGAEKSQHMKGEAIDIDCDKFGNGDNNELLNFIKENLDFDQMIGEYPDATGKFDWVHVSKKRTGRNRKEVLVKLKAGYIPLSSWKAGMV